MNTSSGTNYVPIFQSKSWDDEMKAVAATKSKNKKTTGNRRSKKRVVRRTTSSGRLTVQTKQLKKHNNVGSPISRKKAPPALLRKGWISPEARKHGAGRVSPMLTDRALTSGELIKEQCSPKEHWDYLIGTRFPLLGKTISFRTAFMDDDDGAMSPLAEHTVAEQHDDDDDDDGSADSVDPTLRFHKVSFFGLTFKFNSKKFYQEMVDVPLDD